MGEISKSTCYFQYFRARNVKMDFILTCLIFIYSLLMLLVAEYMASGSRVGQTHDTTRSKNNLHLKNDKILRWGDKILNYVQAKSLYVLVYLYLNFGQDKKKQVYRH